MILSLYYGENMPLNYWLNGSLLALAMGILILGGGAFAADDSKESKCDPYSNYGCLDDYLGQDFGSRFLNYYKLEMNHAAAPSDPNAPSSHREGWPATPQSTPPMPFTEWPHGATTPIGVTRPNSVDSPFMA